MIQAYRRLAEKVPYPLHLGVTEAGPAFTGTVKSAIGIGTLLADGIGDTMRVSLTADPVEEVKVAWEILRVLGLRHKGPIMIACPSCGRTNVDVLDLAERVERAPGRLRRGVRGGRHGLRRERPRRGRRRRLRHRRRAGTPASSTPTARCCARCPRRVLVDELFSEIDAWIAARHGAAAAQDPQARAAGRAGGRLALAQSSASPAARSTRRSAACLAEVRLELREPVLGSSRPTKRSSISDAASMAVSVRRSCGRSSPPDGLCADSPNRGIADSESGNLLSPGSLGCSRPHVELQAQGSDRVCDLRGRESVPHTAVNRRQSVALGPAGVVDRPLRSAAT